MKLKSCLGLIAILAFSPGVSALAQDKTPEPAPFFEAGPYSISELDSSGFLVTTISRDGEVTTIIQERVDSLSVVRDNAVRQAMQAYTNAGQAQVELWRSERQASELERLVNGLDSGGYYAAARSILANRYVDTWTIKHKEGKHKIELKENWRADISETRRLVFRPLSRTWLQVRGLFDEKEWVNLFSQDGDRYEGRDPEGNRITMTRK